MKTSLKLVGYVSLLLALAWVFGLYTRPDFMFNLANQVWGCF